MSLPANSKLGFIGGGQMSRSICLGLLESHSIQPENVWTSDTNEKQLSLVKKRGVNTTLSNIEVAQNTSILLLCVKPNVVSTILKELTPYINNQLIISIAAGIPLSQLSLHIPHARIVRVMPNTPSLVGAGASAFALNENCSQKDAEIVSLIFDAIGCSMSVNEKDLDAVTGLSGSGPAYVFLMIEALADGGVRSGLSREVALKLAAQTVFGAAKMCLELESHPAQLKDSVTSPGGTTIAGVHALESRGFRAALIDAVYSATQRAKELGQQSNSMQQTQHSQIQKSDRSCHSQLSSQESQSEYSEHSQKSSKL